MYTYTYIEYWFFYLKRKSGRQYKFSDLSKKEKTYASFWWGCEVTGFFVRHWWECKMVQPLRKNGTAISYKTKQILITHPSPGNLSQRNESSHPHTSWIQCSFFFFFFFFWLLGPHPWHMEIPRAKGPWSCSHWTIPQPQQLRICNLLHSSQQRQILNPLSKAGDRTQILMDACWVR